MNTIQAAPPNDINTDNNPKLPNVLVASTTTPKMAVAMVSRFSSDTTERARCHDWINPFSARAGKYI
jgi:hypothetical protein